MFLLKSVSIFILKMITFIQVHMFCNHLLVMHIYICSFVSGYHCYFIVGNGVTADGDENFLIFGGNTINSNECVIKCIGMIQEHPNINGVTYKKSTRLCFCKLKMVKSNGDPDYKSCFLTSKSLIISIQLMVPPKSSRTKSL